VPPPRSVRRWPARQQPVSGLRSGLRSRLAEQRERGRRRRHRRTRSVRRRQGPLGRGRPPEERRACRSLGVSRSSVPWAKSPPDPDSWVDRSSRPHGRDHVHPIRIAIVLLHLYVNVMNVIRRRSAECETETRLNPFRGSRPGGRPWPTDIIPAGRGERHGRAAGIPAAPVVPPWSRRWLTPSSRRQAAKLWSAESVPSAPSVPTGSNEARRCPPGGRAAVVRRGEYASFDEPGRHSTP
jgi:hypothetical protein